jgi:hypothetical protein
MVMLADIVRLIVAVVAGSFLLALLVACLVTRTARSRIKACIAVILVYGVGIFSVWYAFIGNPKQQQVIADMEAQKARFIQARQAAQKHFEERCKSAGERIVRQVEGVEGVTLLKVRPFMSSVEDSDRNFPGAAATRESSNESYIASFLRDEKVPESAQAGRFQLSDQPTALPGYRYVDVVEAESGPRTRYESFYDDKNVAPAEYLPIPKLRKVAAGKSFRYAVTYEDIMDAEDRKHWVAGTVLKVLDMKDGSVIAEQTIFIFDPALGATDGGRRPWSWAATYAPRCPKSMRLSGATTRFFVDRVLIPSRRTAP